MAFLRSPISRKVILSIILAWGVASFFLFNSQNRTLLNLIVIIALLGLGLIWRETSPVFNLILLSFFSAYAFYVFFLQLGLPLWLLMISVLIIFSYLFTYTEQKIGILSNKRLIYLVLFSLIILEVFLTLSYFLINPISQSLIIATVVYLFIGFCYTILAKHENSRFYVYLIVSAIIIIAIFFTSG